MHQEAVLDARTLGQAESKDSAQDRREALAIGDTVTVHLRRFDPTLDVESRLETYRVPYSRMMRVLDVLNYIAEDLEEDLAYRWFCGVKKCGTCAVRMNGREVLACWEAAEPEMTIEPLAHLKVVRDLVVDRQPYEDRVTSLFPWLKRPTEYPGFPERLPHVDMKQASRALDCLSCLACYSACPVLDLGEETGFSGPAPIVQLAQNALDPRDGMDRGKIAAEGAEIFSCVSCYRCEEVCPVGIPIVSDIIEPLKRRAFRGGEKGARHAAVFATIIEERGRIDPSKLVLGIQGLGAMRNLTRVLSLWRRGKIDPLKTYFGRPIETIQHVRRLFQQTRE